MLRKFVLTITILIFYLLQTTLFKALSLASVAPNLLIILTFAAGFMRGKKEGMFVGLFSGPNTPELLTLAPPLGAM